MISITTVGGGPVGPKFLLLLSANSTLMKAYDLAQRTMEIFRSPVIEDGLIKQRAPARTQQRPALLQVVLNNEGVHYRAKVINVEAKEDPVDLTVKLNQVKKILRLSSARRLHL